MAKGVSSIGFIILGIAAVLYLIGNTFWLGFSMLGFLVELIGWAVYYKEHEQNKNGG